MINSKVTNFVPPEKTMNALPEHREQISRFLEETCGLDQSVYQLDLLVSEVIPYIFDKKGMEAQSLLVAFLYVYDRVDSQNSHTDASDLSLEEVVRSLKRLLRGETIDSSLFFDEFGASLLRRLCGQLKDDLFFDIFVEEMECFLDVTLKERSNRAHRRVPPPELYFDTVRDDSCGVAPCVLTSLMFHPRRETLCREFWRLNLSRQILTLCKRIISIHNDVFGLDREKAVGDVNNFVLSLSSKVDERHAIAKAVTTADDMYAQFKSFKSDSIREGLFALWEACHCWIAGNWEWTLRNTKRFSTVPGAPIVEMDGY